MLEGIEKIRRDLRGKETAYLLVPNFLKQLDAIEREVKERYVELPTDDNGKTVRYGGYAKVYPYDGEPMKVRALYRSGFGWSVIFTDGSKEPLYRVLACEPPAPTVEDVLNELCLEYVKSWNGESSKSERREIVAKYTAKLQLREE